MQAVVSTIKLSSHRETLAEALVSHDCAVFIDTSLLTWGYRLNDEAMLEFEQWLNELANCRRLAIPAWVIHEYNANFLNKGPSSDIVDQVAAKQLSGQLEKLERAIHMTISDLTARQISQNGKEGLISAYRSASKLILETAAQIDKTKQATRKRHTQFLVDLISQCGLHSNIHRLVGIAQSEAVARYANRLSPGFLDSKKQDNAIGDLIIWKEMLEECSARGITKALLLTNDMKVDWVYTPETVALPNGRDVSGHNPSAKGIKLPKPDLITEFLQNTGSTALHIVDIETTIGLLSDSRLASGRTSEFANLAYSLEMEAHTSTDYVMQWFKRNPEKYHEALKGVCYWQREPSEVNFSEFEAWTMAHIGGELGKYDDDVSWGTVFCQFFL